MLIYEDSAERENKMAQDQAEWNATVYILDWKTIENRSRVKILRSPLMQEGQVNNRNGLTIKTVWKGEDHGSHSCCHPFLQLTEFSSRAAYFKFSRTVRHSDDL
jgi:hypothetical protein